MAVRFVQARINFLNIKGASEVSFVDVKIKFSSSLVKVGILYAVILEKGKML